MTIRMQTIPGARVACGYEGHLFIKLRKLPVDLVLQDFYSR